MSSVRQQDELLHQGVYHYQALSIPKVSVEKRLRSSMKTWIDDCSIYLSER